MKQTRNPPGAGRATKRVGLGSLPEVELPETMQKRLVEALGRSTGDPVWKERKRAEARDLFALAHLAPAGRLEVDFLDLREAVRAVVRLDVPVSTRPQPDGPVAVAENALLGLTYPREVLYKPLPGMSFVQIVQPASVFHANVVPGPVQLLCLGPSLPPGIRLTEIVLMAYGALSMQSVMIDPSDPAGLLNPEAAGWWQENLDRVPLTRTAFLEAAGAEG